MLNEENQFINLDDIDVTSYIELLEDSNSSDFFQDIPLSSSVLDDDAKDLSSMLDEHTESNNNNDPFSDIAHSPIIPTDALVAIPGTAMDSAAIVDNSHREGEDFEQNLDYDLYEETIVQQDISQVPEQIDFWINEDPFESVADDMFVKEQPKADQRARYESDGPRFLPDAKKHPTAIHLPDLTSKLCKVNETYGIIVNMVTSESNPKKRTFVHVNGIKYRTNDAIELSHGRIFLPITEAERKKFEKTFSRLSIICKKFDEYTFDLILFNPSNKDAITEKYTLVNEDTISKAAKGKQFTMDYDLLCYKIVFQLAFKRDDTFFVSHIQCETNIINEQKTPTKGMKRKASSNNNLFQKRKDSMKRRTLNASKKSKPLVPSFTERPLIRTSNRKTKRSKGSSVGN